MRPRDGGCARAALVVFVVAGIGLMAVATWEALQLP